MVLIIAVLIIIARVFFKLPNIESRVDSYSIPVVENSFWQQKIATNADRHPGLSGIKILASGADAFTMRILLIRQAEVSIDAQYYIWHNDLTGLLLLQEIKEAADRGVRVRLLLDDNGIDGLDSIISQLNQHEMIDIRLYNPFLIRRFKVINFTWDFFRLNRRMHNKAIVVDGVAAIIGGRNIGDEYFSTGLNPHYVDLDVLTIGEVLPAITDNFDLYFNSSVAIPVEQIINVKSSRNVENLLTTALKPLTATEQHRTYREALINSELAQAIKANNLSIEWTQVTLISDDPQKTLGIHSDDELMVHRLNAILESPKATVDIVTPYFVPGRAVKLFSDLTSRDVQVRILTNSFDANDVIPVHAGYAKYRKKLLKAGVGLYELKAAQVVKDNKSDMGIMGSSGASLHAKTFAVDGHLVFVGSFNFDPRSTMLNTEMGVVIESRELAGKIHNYFANSLHKEAYTLSLNKDNDIVWVEYESELQSNYYQNDPNSTSLQRMVLKIIGWLPIQKLL